MFFRLLTGGNYYANEFEISDDVKKLIPDNVTLIYWDYYSTDEEHYNRQIKLHTEIKKDIWFAGGLWTWSGITPHNAFSIEAMKPAVKSCIEYGVKDVFMTMWGDDGSECSKFAILPSLFYVSEFSKGNFDINDIKAKFKIKYGISFDDFMLLDLPDTANDAYKRIVNPDKYMLYSDCFTGLFDSRVQIGEGKKYAECAKRLAKYQDNSKYGYIFKTQKALCEVLEIKYELGAKTRKAYLEKNIPELRRLVSQYAELLNRVKTFYEAFKTQWMRDNKAFGFEVQDIRLGGLMLRINHCSEMLEDYIAGKTDRIEELEQPVLDYFAQDSTDGISCNVWSNIVTPNII